MDLKSGYPFWAVKNGLMHAFPPLQEDLRCDVAIIGGGITGALIADELSAHGHDVAVVDQRDVGWGSTSASTALLQYEIDTHLVDLARRHGEAQAALAYRACVDALEQLRAIAAPWRDVEFARNGSLYFASRRRDVRALREEHAARTRHGIAVEYLSREVLRREYGLDAPAALLSADGARVDPYRLAHRLLQRLQGEGVAVFDRTRMLDFEVGTRTVTLRMEHGPVVRAGHLVLAAGYASQHWLAEAVFTTCPSSMSSCVTV